MFTYIIICGIFCSSFLLYRLDTHLAIKDLVNARYKRWESLNQLVSTTQQNKLLIALISLRLIFQSMYIALLQYMNTTIRKLDNKTYEITYVINGKMYKMITIPKRGPSPVLQISDDEQNDVTSHILSYMGPQYDWHGNRLTPQFFGHKSLTFELGDGTEHTYTENTHVELK